MQEHALGAGEELVFENGTRLTVLAVGAGEVLLAITAPEPGGVAGPQAGCRPPSSTQGALSTAHKPTAGEVGPGRSN